MSISCGCIVRARGIDPTQSKSTGRPFALVEDGMTSITSSGILIDRKEGILVTTATLFSPFSKGTVITEGLANVKVDVMIEDTYSQGSQWKKAVVVNVLRIDGVASALSELLGDLEDWQLRWKVADKNEQGFRRTLGDADKIAVIQLESKNAQQTLSTYRGSESLCKGEPIRIVGSPYGIVSPTLFMNCVSSGTISNIYNTDKGKILFTDARCFPGMEGGPAIDASGNIVGLLLPPFTKMDDQQIEFTFMMCMSSVLGTVKKHTTFTLHGFQEIKNTTTEYSVLRAFEQSLVLVEVENSWGSGIIISSDGYILTNAHLLRPYLPPKTIRKSKLIVRARILQQQVSNTALWEWHNCDVCFVSDVFSHNDVALLKVIDDQSSKFKCVAPDDKVMDTTQLGTPIFVIGYALFKPSYYLQPTVTEGVLAKIVRHQNKPVILQTSASVHSGNSGGLLVTREGKFLGMVTCNIRHRSYGEGNVITKLNFSIPTTVLAPFFDYIRSKDRTLLSALDVADPDVKALWQLQLKRSEEEQEESKPNFHGMKSGEKFSSFLKNFKQSKL